MILRGDCLDLMPTMAENSVDAIVTDPPYALTANKKGGSGAASVELNSPYGRARIGAGNGGFMGKEWDGKLPGPEIWAAALRVAKPGAYLVAFGGTRTHHRLMVAIEDAGWEIRDCLMWLYGSGFPKSLDVGKALDKAAGAEREVVGSSDPRSRFDGASRGSTGHSNEYGTITSKGVVTETAPATDAAKQWDGWGTALKPAWEPIILARKPLAGTVAQNVLTHGVGGLNIDGCRIEVTDAAYAKNCSGDRGHADNRSRDMEFGMGCGKAHDGGRWPANLLLDEESAAVLDAQTGNRRSAGNYPSASRGTGESVTFGKDRSQGPLYADSGGASRFFYVAKASKSERERGCDDLPAVPAGEMTGGRAEGSDGLKSPRAGAGRTSGARNHHPTVKPVALMRWLVRLVCPPGGMVLDPFAGSGTTGLACLDEGCEFTGIEITPECADIADQRLGITPEPTPEPVPVDTSVLDHWLDAFLSPEAEAGG